MSHIHRLQLAQKFIVLCLLGLFMAAVPAALYVSDHLHKIRDARLQASGTAPVIALQKVVQLMQQHRGTSAGMLSGNETLAARRPALADGVNRAMALADARLTGAEAPSAAREQWGELKKRWLDLEREVGSRQLKLGESTQRHTRLIADLMLLSDTLLDDYNLAQDSGEETSALIRGTLTDVPALAEKLGVMRALGAGFLTTGQLPPEGRTSLLNLLQRVNEIGDSMARNLDKATRLDSGLQSDLTSGMKEIKASLARTLTLADKDLINAPTLTLPAPAYFDEFTRTIDSLFNFNAGAMQLLVSRLDQRVAQAQRNMTLTLGFLLLMLVGAIMLATFFVHSITRPIHEAINVARAVAQGDLTRTIHVEGRNETAQLMSALHDMQHSLARVVASVRQGSESVARASAEIAQGNQNLSARTESQASALQQTAASMEQLNATVQNNASHSQQADHLARGVSSVALKGGEVVAQVVQTMKGINESSHRIADIITVIDAIAFQTNILALNAAVEAARAGEQGRGFAVVAGEVRALAGRSAEAAKEIKSLITDSVARIEQGTALVNQAGTTMQEMVNGIGHVAHLMGDISTASAEQSRGVSQVGEAVTQMDQVTQQNAALVEEMAAAAASLSSQASELTGVVSLFRLGHETGERIARAGADTPHRLRPLQLAN